MKHDAVLLDTGFFIRLNESPRRKRTGYPGIFSIRRKRRGIVPAEI